jgi:DNA-directed RNA polymerase specialized sigma24 family protein
LFAQGAVVTSGEILMVQARPRPISVTRAVTRPDEIPSRASEATSLFERLFAEYQTPILNYLFRLVGDPALAEDLVQEAFTRAGRARARLIVVENPRAWLYRIATNAARTPAPQAANRLAAPDERRRQRQRERL